MKTFDRLLQRFSPVTLLVFTRVNCRPFWELLCAEVDLSFGFHCLITTNEPLFKCLLKKNTASETKTLPIIVQRGEVFNCPEGRGATLRLLQVPLLVCHFPGLELHNMWKTLIKRDKTDSVHLSLIQRHFLSSSCS